MKAAEAIKRIQEAVKQGPCKCHVDLEPDEEPDACVLDSEWLDNGGSHGDCRYAVHYGKKAREHCGEWRPVNFSVRSIEPAQHAEDIAAILASHAELVEALALAHDALDAAQHVHAVTSLPLAIERFGSREACAEFSRQTWMVDVPKAIAESRTALSNAKGESA